MTAAIPWRAKARAFSAHLGLSAVVFAVIIAVTVATWYPPPFFWVDGALHVTILAALVDLVAGPLLTFIVYRPGKRYLTLNLAVIAAIQCAALGWGVQALYGQRPVAAAFVPHKQNRFFPVTEAQLAAGGATPGQMRAMSRERPPLVFVELPDDEAEAARLLMSTEVSVLRQPERFRPIEGARLARVLSVSRTPETYKGVSPHLAEGIERFTAEHGGDARAFAFIPLYGRFGYAVLALSRDDGRFAGVAAREISLH